MSNVAPQQWTKPSLPGYFISTDRSLLDLAALNDAFDSEEMFWTKRWSDADLKQVVDSSLCVAIYHAGEDGKRTQVGFGRVITDYLTFGYLTDVYVTASHQGKGLAKWLIQVIDEIQSGWPSYRRMMLMTGQAMSERFYSQAVKGLKPHDPSKGHVIMQKTYAAAFDKEED